jgi:hypothetical protein
MYLQQGPPIAENETTTHRTHRTHNVESNRCVCLSGTRFASFMRLLLNDLVGPSQIFEALPTWQIGHLVQQNLVRFKIV